MGGRRLLPRLFGRKGGMGMMGVVVGWGLGRALIGGMMPRSIIKSIWIRILMGMNVPLTS